jgi:plasmid stability protein
MPKRPTPGTVAMSFELPPELVERLKLRAQQQGRSVKGELLRAIQRHLLHPEPDREPEPELAPLPPVAKPQARPGAKPAGKGKRK